jgi:hypothetical protein
MSKQVKVPEDVLSALESFLEDPGHPMFAHGERIRRDLEEYLPTIGDEIAGFWTAMGDYRISKSRRLLLVTNVERQETMVLRVLYQGDRFSLGLTPFRVYRGGKNDDGDD